MPGWGEDWRNSPPGGWDHYYAEEYIEDMKADRYKRDKKVKGKWVIISKYRTGSMQSKEMSYANAVKEVDEMKLRDVRTMSKNKNLGRFNPLYEIKKVKKR